MVSKDRMTLEAQGANCSRRYAPFEDAQKFSKDARHALKDMRVVFAHVLRQDWGILIATYATHTSEHASKKKPEVS